jgi:lysyl-tRNA synthetase class II
MPCAGWGMGVDRFIMLLTHKDRIQEVISFPLMREELEKGEQK